MCFKIPICMGQRPTFIAMMLLTTSFFLVEIVVGYATRSMALVADSFHMLSDIISLVVGFCALKMSRKRSREKVDGNTYGWVRAEVLGALVNAVFLIALCFSILIEALKRLIEPESIRNPLLILGVGAGGLVINIIGMILFHGHTGHGHSHGGHGHSHGGNHGHSQHGNNHGHSHESKTKKKKEKTNKNEEENQKIVVANGNDKQINGYSNQALDSDEVIRAHTGLGKQDSIGVVIVGKTNTDKTFVAVSLEDAPRTEDNSDAAVALGDEKKSGKKKHAPKSSGAMNMRGVYLHILGDALGSVIVVVAALLIYYFGEQKWTLHVDPAMSIIMVFIILKTSIPLLKESSLILLQYVPPHIQLSAIEKKLLQEFPEIESVHEFHVWQLTGSKIVASLHAKFSSHNDYVGAAPLLKKFFHDQGIHSTTIQPEHPQKNSIEDESECVLKCDDVTCNDKQCCVNDTTPDSDVKKPTKSEIHRHNSKGDTTFHDSQSDNHLQQQTSFHPIELTSVSLNDLPVECDRESTPEDSSNCSSAEETVVNLEYCPKLVVDEV